MQISIPNFVPACFARPRARGRGPGRGALILCPLSLSLLPRLHLVELMISIAMVVILMVGIHQVFKMTSDTVGMGDRDKDRGCSAGGYGAKSADRGWRIECALGSFQTNECRVNGDRVGSR